MNAPDLPGCRRSRGRPRRAALVLAMLALVALGPQVASAYTGNPAVLRAELHATEQRYGTAQTRLGTLRARQEAALGALDRIDGQLRLATASLRRDTAALAADRALLAEDQAALAHDRRRVTALKGDAAAVLQYQQVLGAAPLDTLVTILDARTLGGLMTRLDEMAQIGAFTGGVVHAAQVVETRMRRVTAQMARRRLQAARVRARAAATEAALAQERLRESALTTRLAEATRQVSALVSLLGERASSLRIALLELVAKIRSGRVPPGQVFALVQAIARRYGVDPLLVWAVIDVESGGDATAVSTAGAEGLMQLMPGTARGLGVSNPFNPSQNISGGVRYLAMLIRHYHGNLALALAAYNMGPAAVDRYGGRLPPDPGVRAYVATVLGKLANTR
jgi:soluble lytic murein transglycosylase-like protein